MRGWAALVASGLVLACGGESLEGDGTGGVVVAATGGRTGASSGGSSLGGEGATDGGRSPGGSDPSGGSSSSGGADSTGGTSSGGGETGGSSSGGAASGGTGSGGEANACSGWTSESFAYGECAVVLGYPKTLAASSEVPFPCDQQTENSATYCAPRGNDNPAIESWTLWFRAAPGETLTIVRGTWNESFTECSAGPSCGK